MPRSDVPDRSQYNSQVVAGVSIAKAINLYATSVYAMLRHARRKSPEARVKSDRTVFHIAEELEEVRRAIPGVAAKSGYYRHVAHAFHVGSRACAMIAGSLLVADT